MNTTAIIGLSVVLWAPLAGMAAWGLRKLAVYMQARGYNDSLVKIAGGAATQAGLISLDLQRLPPGASLDAAKTMLLTDGVTAMKTVFAESIATTGYSDTQLLDKLAGALGNNPLHAALVAPAVVAPAVVAVPATQLASVLGLTPGLGKVSP